MSFNDSVANGTEYVSLKVGGINSGSPMIAYTSRGVTPFISRKADENSQHGWMATLLTARADTKSCIPSKHSKGFSESHPAPDVGQIATSGNPNGST